MIVRQEQPTDVAAIGEVNAQAFARPSEGRLVDRLRSAGLIIASIVAVVDDRVVGSIVFSSLPIATPPGTIEAAALAPMAVVPRYQRRGIGTALVHKGLAICKQRGVAVAIVLGDPSYYARFGFSSELTKGIASPYTGESAWMALELVEGVLSGVEGRVDYPQAFEDCR